MVMDRCAIFRSAILNTGWQARDSVRERDTSPGLYKGASTKSVKVINKNMKDIEQETHFSQHCHMWRIGSIYCTMSL